jgi:hypothetical protein
LLGPEPTRLAIGILRDQQLVTGLPAYLPTDVAVGSKSGDLPGLRADMALLERAGRWVSVAVIADDLGESGAPEATYGGTAVLPVFAALGALAAERLYHPG